MKVTAVSRSWTCAATIASTKSLRSCAPLAEAVLVGVPGEALPPKLVQRRAFDVLLVVAASEYEAAVAVLAFVLYDCSYRLKS